MTAAMHALIERLTAWAHATEDIRAAIIVGSYARYDRPADQWSDLDVLLITPHPDPYLHNPDWLNTFGIVWVTHLESIATGGATERRVLFEGALDVDFTVISPDTFRHLSQRPENIDIIRRGVRILVDKDRLMARMTLPVGMSKPYQPPTEAEFLNVVNDFWYHAVWTAKKLGRGELWTAKASCDNYMKWLLLRMIEWHAHATLPQTRDVWFNGRFLEQWAAGYIIQGMKDTFAHYNHADIARALLATMALFRRVARETADQLVYTYPHDADHFTSTWVEKCIAENLPPTP
jgi:aminoglycoside 6-adenylyltransferase